MRFSLKSSRPASSSWRETDESDDSSGENIHEPLSEDEDLEPPHPLGFSSTSRYSLYSTTSDCRRKWGYLLSDENDSEGIVVKPYPPVSSFPDPSTRMELRKCQRLIHSKPMSVGRLSEKLKSLTTSKTVAKRPRLPALVPLAAIQTRGEQTNVNDLAQQHKLARRNLQKILDGYKEKADKVRRQQEEVDRKAAEAAEAEKARKQKEEEEEAKRNDSATTESTPAESSSANVAPQQSPSRKESTNQEASTARDDSNYVARAESLIAQLEKVRKSVEPFDKSKTVGKRRLGMKKIVNGKVNTLSDNAAKIQQVAQDVSRAIQEAREEDTRLKEERKANPSAVEEVTTLGKRYLVDLLCSKVIVRVQAEGFNG